MALVRDKHTGLYNKILLFTTTIETSASGLVVKSNVAIVGPRVRFSAGAESVILANHSELLHLFIILTPPFVCENIF